MIKKVLGYIHGNRKMPIYPVEPGTISTRAVVVCSQCHRAIRSSGGPMQSAWCIACTDDNEWEDD